MTPPDPKRIVEAKEYLLPDLLAEPNSDEKTDSHEDDTPVPVPHETQLVQTNSKNTPDIKGDIYTRRKSIIQLSIIMTLRLMHT